MKETLDERDDILAIRAEAESMALPYSEKLDDHEEVQTIRRTARRVRCLR